MRFSVDAEGRLTDWCVDAEQITGFVRREVIGFSFLEFITCPFRGIVEDTMVVARNGVEAKAVEMPFFGKSGDRLDVSLRASPCGKSDVSTGALVLECALVQTLTLPSKKDTQSAEVKDTADQPYKRSRHQEEKAVSQAMLFTIDESGCVSDWNKQAEELTLFFRDEVMGLSFLDFITRPFRDSVAEMIRQATNAEVVRPLEIPFYDKAGVKLDVVLKAYTCYNQVLIEGQLVEACNADEACAADEASGKNAVSCCQPSKKKTMIWTAETCDSFGPLSQLQTTSQTLESLSSIAE
eukprot:TRINITY_DN9402_c0_g2_i1.p1 TRINITY_DN9402_c0_g2~~TRINITY_DN9402_c0_g2_i1.p1  ORF type:complete len:295 (-),score=54.11 TRINITY_DN9402_c0_g2_i1:396-1280(-)